jgi:chemotaxis signal transduction protein
VIRVQASSSHRSFDSDFLARWQTAPAHHATPSEPRRHDALLARGGGRRVLLRLRELSEIVPYTIPVPLPGAPPEVLGVTTVRGEVLTVLSLGRLLAVEANEEKRQPADEPDELEPRFLAVVEAGSVRFALALEEILEAVRLEATAGADRGAGDDVMVNDDVMVGGERCIVLDISGVADRVFEN